MKEVNSSAYAKAQNKAEQIQKADFCKKYGICPYCGKEFAKLTSAFFHHVKDCPEREKAKEV